jgi:CRP/FNR family cyclic AMP-dependent transcriptional regulator
MACHPDELRKVPLFSLLDDEELAVLAGQVDLRSFVPRQRIYKIGDPSDHAYLLVSGAVRVTTIDEDQQEVIVDQPAEGEFFGFASMLAQTAHETCCGASPTRGWISWPCSVDSSTRRSTWSGCARPATPTT